MGKSTWRDKQTEQRRRTLLDDYMKLSPNEPNESAVMAKLAVKYGLSVTTVYKDLKEAKEALHGNQ